MGRKKSRHAYYFELKAQGYERSPRISTEPKSKSEAYIALFKTLLNSPAFHELTGNQRSLYIFCMTQWGTDPFEDKYSEPDNVTEVDRRESFYMNLALGHSSGIYGDKSKNTFYNDLKRLEAVGFIDCIYHGKGKGAKSIYRLSDRWKNFGLPKKELSPS